MRFDEIMRSQGFLSSMYDLCVYMKKMNDETFNPIIVIVYVDNMLILTKNQYDVDECKNQLQSAFKMNYTGKSKNILDMILHRDFEKKRL